MVQCGSWCIIATTQVYETDMSAARERTKRLDFSNIAFFACVICRGISWNQTSNATLRTDDQAIIAQETKRTALLVCFKL